MFQKRPGKTKASHQYKTEMEAYKKKNAKKENIWTADANSDVSDSQVNDSNDSDETKIVYNVFLKEIKKNFDLQHSVQISKYLPLI